MIRILTLLLLGFATPLVAEPCFNLGRLPRQDRAYADSLLQELADGAGLYTFVGGLKPISSERTASMVVAPQVDTVQLAVVERWRRLLPALQCGEVGVLVQRYAMVYSGRDSLERRVAASLVLFHREGVRRAIASHADFFARLGLTPSADPDEVLAVIEHTDRADRWRGYGYLFGYPDPAVDFFAEAGIRGDSLKTVMPRDFRRVETYHKWPAERGGPPTQSTFVYAVPKDAPETPEDIALRDRAAPIYTEYLRRRPGRPGEFAKAMGRWVRQLR